MKFLLDFLEEIGIGYKYLINGFVGALVWSLFKKLKFWEAVRQIFIGSLVAGYVTPIIAYKEGIPIEYVAALSFVVGMMGMLIIDGIYKYTLGKLKQIKIGRRVIENQDVET